MTGQLKYDELYTTLITQVPELRNRIELNFGQDYDLTEEFPGAYPLFEDVVQDFVWESLETNANSDVLVRLFGLFEQMASSGDRKITDLLRIAILEPLVYRAIDYKLAKRYMGRKTTEYASWEQLRQNAL